MTTYKHNGVIMKSFANWSILIFIITVLFAGLSGCGYGKNVSLPRGTEYAIVESDLLRASHGRVLSFDKHGKNSANHDYHYKMVNFWLRIVKEIFISLVRAVTIIFSLLTVNLNILIFSIVRIIAARQLFCLMAL